VIVTSTALAGCTLLPGCNDRLLRLDQGLVGIDRAL
jgi:hypothetical protein